MTDIRMFNPHPVHIAKYSGWFWAVPTGNKTLYYGPYKSEEIARRRGPRDEQKGAVGESDA